MRVRDLFADYSVQLLPLADHWVVSLLQPDGQEIVLRTSHDLPDALAVVHELALMLVDDMPLMPDAILTDGSRRQVMVMLSRHALDQPPLEEQSIDQLLDTLPTWEWSERRLDG